MRAPSRKTIRRVTMALALGAVAAATPALVQSGSQAEAAPAALVTIDLCASELADGLTLPDATTVDIWGFSLDDGLVGCADDPAQLPGPVLKVNVGDIVTVNLHNDLSEEVSIVFPGQSLVPNAVVVAPGADDSYEFTASKPGTYLYETGTNTSIQVAMGLYGALVVNPTTGAYGAGTEYHVDQVLVLSEIDPNLNNTTDPNDFDFVGDPNDYNAGYHPTYFLINGEAHPDTDPVAAAAGDDVLLRYLNAGLAHHTMTLLGDRQRVIAKDAYPTGANQYEAVAETIPAGSTLDVIVSAGAAGTYPLYNRNLDVTNDGAYPGGMLTFLEVS